MIYEFKSKSEASVVFTGPGGDWLLALIGRAPAPSGIIEPEAMPAAIEAIETAIAHEEARRIRPPLVAPVEGDLRLPLRNGVHSRVVRRQSCAAPPTSVARTASGFETRATNVAANGYRSQSIP